MPIQSTQEKFIYTLGEALSGENQLLQGYQQLAGQVTNEQLRQGIQTHIEQSQQQVQNIQQIFSTLGQEPQEQPNDAAQGLVSDAQRCVSQAGNDLIRDGLILEASLKAEHFEIGGYQGLVLGAQLMGQQEAAQLLQQNLQQEEQMAQQLQQLAPQLLQQAMQAEGMQVDQGALEAATQGA